MPRMLWGGEGVAPHILNPGPNIDASVQLHALGILPPEQLPVPFKQKAG